jgi:hypothetical protein
MKGVNEVQEGASFSPAPRGTRVEVRFELLQ